MRELKELALPVGRALIVALFLWSGLRKLGHPDAVIAMIGRSLPYPTLGFGISIACELGVGTLLLLGYRTRAMAVLLALFTLATAIAFHSDFGDRDALTNFLKNLSILGGLLHVVVAGGGRFSIDGLLVRRDGAQA
ncbi:DoxX family protein [Sphingomonas sp. QA11]|uniref:DoxX family protein n=1 Tax=Sphingomonas sp. QA11 TaxID=2950605 RepID=UPI00234B8815|nr:DoxX family protein [Sphingomonas sp. QA11]WCM28611.1 DoxX family protein [Sphingomonas sp. QA11]